MSVTGFWILTTAADEQIRTWRERYADELAAAAKDREQGMAWWTGLGDVAFWEPDGRQGWQLTSDEAVVARPEVERLLADADRGELVEQIDRWLDYGADGSASEGVEVADGVVRVFREAVACGLGVAAAVVWF